MKTTVGQLLKELDKRGIVNPKSMSAFMQGWWAAEEAAGLTDWYQEQDKDIHWIQEQS